jgi:hypothetical protein
MWKQTLSTILTTLLFHSPAGTCLAKELLFAKEPNNREHSSRLAELERTEFEPRMFGRREWYQRLIYFSGEPDLDETLEVYLRSDGTRWLSHRRAIPSLYSVMLRRLIPGGNFDWKKEVDAVRISTHEIGLPVEVANEIDLLWQTMLPGVTNPPPGGELNTHAPIFDAFVRKDHSVEAGRVCPAAYNTPIYRAFVDVIKDLREVCDRGSKPTDPIFKRLPKKIRDLRARL